MQIFAFQLFPFEAYSVSFRKILEKNISSSFVIIFISCHRIVVGYYDIPFDVCPSVRTLFGI